VLAALTRSSHCYVIPSWAERPQHDVLTHIATEGMSECTVVNDTIEW